MIDLVKPILNSKRCSSECINAPDEAGDSALHIATRNGYTEIVKLLWKNKANQKQKNYVSNRGGVVHCKLTHKIYGALMYTV